MNAQGRRFTRRGVVATASVAAAAAGGFASSACGGARREGAGNGVQRTAQPRDVVFTHDSVGDVRDRLWEESFRKAAEATGHRVSVVWEPGATFWEKRQTEFAGATAPMDVMKNQTNWVLPGGLAGMFLDHNPLFKRDKINTNDWYKTGLDTWSWKGKLYAVPYQVGGEVVHFNKKLFDAKGVKHPHKDWTYDEFLAACRQLNDPANGKYAVQIGQNGIHYMMGTFILNHGGKRLDEAKAKALYGDDPKAIQGAELDVDLHTRYGYAPRPDSDALKAVPQGRQPIEIEMVAMEFNGSFRHTVIRDALGAPNVDFAPPPRGPGGVQTAAVGGNSWSILSLSKSHDAAWEVLRWLYTREGLSTPWSTLVSWPPIVSFAATPQWLGQFEGTHMADCAEVWRKAGHDLLVLPEGNEAWTAMNAPLNRALTGEIAVRQAMQESARQLNDLFAKRPAAWR
jgi:multiple sugar transport system substrate-binding protein